MPPAEQERQTRQARVRAAGAEVVAPGGEAADLEIVVATSGIARDGGIVPVGAWALEAYRRNPVVLLAHQERGFPIAQAVATVPDEETGELRQFWRFHGESEESRTAQALYEGGFMRSASVSFRLRDRKDLTEEEAAELQELAGSAEPPLWIALDAELLEVSAVSVPADPDATVPLDRALNAGRAAGLDVRPLERRLRVLRARCRAGDEEACRRLGRRVEEVEVDGETYRVELEPGEDLDVLARRAAKRALRLLRGEGR